MLDDFAAFPGEEIKKCMRCVFFDSGQEEWRYWSNGGTAFLVNYQDKIYGLTCMHVFKEVELHQLVITETASAQKGSKITGIKEVAFPSGLREAAEGTDIFDLCVFQFPSSINAEFFNNTPYILDASTIATSQRGDKLVVAGVLKDQSEFTENEIHAAFCRLEFLDDGASVDPIARQAIAQFDRPAFERVTGISGAPVYNVTKQALCGMVVRGGLNGVRANIRYIDMFDILKFLEAVHKREDDLRYTKNVLQRRNAK